MKAYRVRIEGRVQGVSFRYYTLQEANRLGIDGWVRNCEDGSVETLI
ncbi:MAG TPA: acylphosphatase, partial [Mariprofundaceae bacterium]|nr:acylphosphatase [Mariprofundaceae bacterium]